MKEQAMEVEVADFPQDAVLVRLDQCTGGCSGMKDGPWKQLCDYMMVYHEENKNYVVLIELKKTLREDAKGMEQLRRSIPVLDYLHSVCCIDSHSGGNARKSYPAVQYVLIGEREAVRLDKRSVRPNMEFKRISHHDIEVNLSLRCQMNFDDLVELHHG